MMNYAEFRMDELLLAAFRAASYEGLYLQHYDVIETRCVKPNPMFSALQEVVTKFLRPANGAQWTCGACGKKRGRKWLWTQLLPFRASDESQMTFSLSFGPWLEPLTPVCGDHILSPWTGEEVKA